MKQWLLFNAFFFLPLILFAQFRFNATCREAYSDITSLHFGEARAFLDQARLTDPGNLIPDYLENYMDFLSVFIGEEQERYDLFKKNYSARERRIEKARKDSPFYHYCLGNMFLQKGILSAKFGEYASAAADVNRAYRELTENEREYPSFLPQKTNLGVIHILAGLVPDNYKWALSLLGIKGDVEQGLMEIKTIACYSGKDELLCRLKIEALFYLAVADANLGKDRQESLDLIRLAEMQSGSEISSNPLFIYAKASILMKCGKNEEALLVLNRYCLKKGDFPFYFLDFLTGKARLNRLDPDADRYFIRFLKNFRGKSYIKSAYQKLAWSYLVRKDTARYREYIGKVKIRGNMLIDGDRQAMREAEKGEQPNIILLKARLLSDGGYNKKALDILENQYGSRDFQNRKDLTEYYYRLGRICQDSGMDNQALKYFRIAYTEGNTLPYYFAANAALQSGIIYERRGDLKNAGNQYRLCLSLDYDEYKASLSQKAKVGLKRISRKKT